MLRLMQAITLEQQSDFCAALGSYPLTPALPSMQQADEHWLVVGEQDVILARCSLWWRHVPGFPSTVPASFRVEWGKLGLIGHYAAQDPTAAQLLLDQACARLTTQHCTLAVGPLDGNTFRPYRLLTERTLGGFTRPHFFLEPDNPDAWPAQWLHNGFQPLAQYFSALGELGPPDAQMTITAQQVAAQGIQLRPVELIHFEEEIRRIYQVVSQSFRHNFLYTGIALDEFMAQYAPVRHYVQPTLALLAEQMDKPVGFIFALPDLAQAQRGEPVDTVIVKTVGVLPELSGLGVGGLLVARCQAAAYTLGYRHVIHALMFEDNISRKISERYARVMRRYTLFGKDL
ncbi:hypothetical protein BH10CHL1_BH10CHL1_50680 [soil metagenome]